MPWSPVEHDPPGPRPIAQNVRMAPPRVTTVSRLMQTARTPAMVRYHIGDVSPIRVFHSDRGSQYAGGPFQDKLAVFGMTGSMSRKGNCAGNAPTERFFNSLKNERVHGTHYASHDAARADLFDYIKVSYNRCRRHSAPGHVSPTPVSATLARGSGRAESGGMRPCPCWAKNRGKLRQTFKDRALARLQPVLQIRTQYCQGVGARDNRSFNARPTCLV